MALYDAAIEGLRAQRARLEADLELWAERASTNGDLPQHASQVERLNVQVSAALASALQGTPVAPEAHAPFAGGVADLPTLRRAVGTVHLLWDFFRDKLAQRDTTAYTAHLGTADDLAWSCYEPFLIAARKAGTVAQHGLKEPPLVFYSPDRAPFAQARTKALHPPGLDSKDLGQVIEELHRMPVPVIGMPWAVANRLPDVVLVGHEVGHVIAEDLGFADEAASVIGGLALDGTDAEQRRTVWKAWSDEIFADVIGVLATGTAFVEGLAAELADAKKDVEQARISVADPGLYPTRTLRIALCNDVLEKVGVTPPTAWSQVYRVAGDSEAYRDDVPRLVKALLDHVWEPIDGRLRDMLPWDARCEQDASAVASAVLDKAAAPVVFDVRTWIAAAMHASLQNPTRFAQLQLDSEMASFIVQRRQDATRSARNQRLIALSEAGAPDDGTRLRSSDQAAGQALAARLGLNPQKHGTQPA